MTTLVNALTARGLSIKDNLVATSNPGATNDSSQGYVVGSMWVNTSKGRAFIARSVGVGVAVWVSLAVNTNPAYILNRWYNAGGELGQVAVGPSGLNGRITFYPHFIRERTTITALGVRVSTTNAGNVQAAIYANDYTTMRPTGGALASTASMSTASAASVSAVVNITLDPGLYWFGTNIDNAVATLMGYSGAAGMVSSLIGSDTQSGALASLVAASCLQVTQAFGTWPTVTAATFIPIAGQATPIVQYQIGAPAITSTTVFAANPPLDTDDTGNVRFNFRAICTLAQNMGNEFRITIVPGVTSTLTVSHVAAGKYAGDPAVPNTVAPLVETLFAGVAGFASKTVSQVSDWTAVGSLAGMLAGDKLLVSFTTGPSGQASLRYQAAPTNSTTWYQSDTPDLLWNVQDVAGLGYNDTVPIWGVGSVETR